jgi:hypothetical protein
MNPIKILKPNEFTAILRGLNFWTLRQKLKDHTTQRVSPIQLLHRIDIYGGFTPEQRAHLQTMDNPKQQQEYIKSHGKLSKTTGEMKSHSFTLQFSQLFIEYVASHVYSTLSTNPMFTTPAVRDTTNTLQQQGNLSNGNYFLFLPALNAPPAITTYGILVGTGTTAPASTDYVMQTLIAHGIASGNLQYQATAVGSAGIVGANVDTIIARVLVNGSGGTVTITEVGMAVTFVNSAGPQKFYLIAHDAVSQAVNNGAVAIVSYDIRTTV